MVKLISKFTFSLFDFYFLIFISNSDCGRQMRDSQSADKEYPRASRYNSNALFNPYRELTRKQSESRKSEAEMIEQTYYPHMLQLFQKNQKSYPNPIKIIECLKAKDKKLEELERSLNQCKQKLRESQRLVRFETKTEPHLPGLSPQQQESTFRKVLQQEYLKIKLKIIPIFQQFLGDSSQIIKFTQSKDEETPQLLFQCFDAIIQNLKTQIGTAEVKAVDRLHKKFQITELRLQKQLLDQAEINQKLRQKVNSYVEQCRVQNEERKKIEKEKNALHTEIYKIHQTIVEKSNLVQSLREQLQNSMKRIEELEGVIQANKNKEHQCESSMKLLEEMNHELQSKNKYLASTNEKLQKQLNLFHKKIEEDLNKNLSKVRSQSTLTSFKIIEGQEKKEETRSKMVNSMDPKQEEIKQKAYVERIINQWRQQLEKIVNEHDREAVIKDNLIDALEKQNKQLKKQIETRRRMEGQMSK